MTNASWKLRLRGVRLGIGIALRLFIVMRRTTPPLIVLLEGEPVLAEITAFRLEFLGYCVERVNSADAVGALAGQREIHLIIVDVQLSGAEGMRAVDKLSCDVATKQIPILAMSSQADLLEVQRAYRAGAKEYLVTPYDPAVLENKIHQLLGAER